MKEEDLVHRLKTTSLSSFNENDYFNHFNAYHFTFKIYIAFEEFLPPVFAISAFFPIVSPSSLILEYFFILFLFLFLFLLWSFS